MVHFQITHVSKGTTVHQIKRQEFKFLCLSLGLRIAEV